MSVLADVYKRQEYMGDFEHMGSELNDATLIFMDLNRLKSVNDVYGHAAGDQFIILSLIHIWL